MIGFVVVISMTKSGEDKMNKLIPNIFVAQPFIENNDFYYFKHKGMKVLLINNNNDSDMCQVAASVGVGSTSDVYFTGFTHFIEHLLFTGSKKFEDEKGLNDTINKYNGERNGVTMSYNTSYFFEFNDQGLNEIIEILADALTNASFKIKSIENEINNVNSEISMRMTHNNALDYYKLLKLIGNDKSSMFNDGFGQITIEKSEESLKETQTQVKQFY